MVRRSAAGVGRSSVSFWLLMVVYPLLNPLGTYPVLLDGKWWSAEFLFSILCVFGATVDAGMGRLKVVAPNRAFLLGLAVWMTANYISGVLHPGDAVGMMMFSMTLKALFGYLVFIAVVSNRRADWLLKAYLVGCAVAGIATIVFSIQAGNLSAVRFAGYFELNAAAPDVSVLRGFARAGAGNLLPLWICLALGLFEPDTRKRRMLFIAAPYFMLLSLLALRREGRG